MYCELEKSKDNYEILKINRENKKYYLGSKYNFERELDKFIKKMEPLTEKDLYIILGLSSLESIKKLLDKKVKETKILIIEMNKEIIECIYKNSMHRKILENKDVVLAKNLEDVKKFLSKEIKDLTSENVKINSFGNYNRIFSKELVDIYRDVKDKLIDNLMEKNTRLFFEEEWIRNEIRNSMYLYRSKIINNLKNNFKNMPAVIVSAGPSLEKNINKLDKEKVYIISGGRTLKTLLNVGIDPDILNIIDGGEISYKLVEDCIEKTKSTIFFNETTNYKIINKHNSGKVISAQQGFISKLYEENIENVIKGGSVANSMAYIASYLGFNPIIFIGQDLAYTDDKGHAKIASYKNKDVNGEKNYFSENDVYVEDIYGNEVRTSLVLKQYIKAMEKIIEEFPNTRFIDATEGGAKIKGTEIKTLEETLDGLSIIKKELIGEEIEDVKLKEKTLKALIKSKEDMKRLIKICEESKELLRNFIIAYKKGHNNMQNINMKMDKLEKEMEILIKKIVLINNKIYALMYELENNEKFIILSKDEKKDILKKRFEMNKKIYDGIIEICTGSINEIELAIK